MTPMEREYPTICRWVQHRTVNTDALREELEQALAWLEGSSTLVPVHTQESHQALLVEWNAGVGFVPHQYSRCGFSGAGNCCCGRPFESALHPHPFMLARMAQERGERWCVCSKEEGHSCHVDADTTSVGA